MPTLRQRCVLALNRWLPLVPFVCYPVLLLPARMSGWFAICCRARSGGALDFMQDIARAILVPGLTFWVRHHPAG